MASNLTVFSYSTTNVSTSAYTTLIASTAISVTQLLVTDTSTQLVKLAIGAAGSEVDLCQLPVSSTVTISFESINQIPVGSRLSIRAISANATTGFLGFTLIQ